MLAGSLAVPSWTLSSAAEAEAASARGEGRRLDFLFTNEECRGAARWVPKDRALLTRAIFARVCVCIFPRWDTDAMLGVRERVLEPVTLDGES